jgi:hypothetical protein
MIIAYVPRTPVHHLFYMKSLEITAVQFIPSVVFSQEGKVNARELCKCYSNKT